MQIDDTALVLAEADFFQICNSEQLRMLGFASEPKAMIAGDVLFRRGDVLDGAFVLVNGTLKSHDGNPDSDPVEISLPGTTIGELALLAKHPRRAQVEAVTDANLIYVPRHAFAKLIQLYPDVAHKAQQKIAGELQQFVRPITDRLERFKR